VLARALFPSLPFLGRQAESYTRTCQSGSEGELVQLLNTNARDAKNWTRQIQSSRGPHLARLGLADLDLLSLLTKPGHSTISAVLT